MVRKRSGLALGRLTPDELETQRRLPLHFLLDNIRSGNNVGSLLRTADAFRIGKVVLTGICVRPPHRDILKTSLGAEKTVPWEDVKDDVVAYLRAEQARGVKVAALEQTDGSVMLEDWTPSPDEEWIIILGNEVRGVEDELLAVADICLEIPQFGAKHSLNVAVSGGMVAWHYMHSCGLPFLRMEN